MKINLGPGAVIAAVSTSLVACVAAWNAWGALAGIAAFVGVFLLCLGAVKLFSKPKDDPGIQREVEVDHNVKYDEKGNPVQERLHIKQTMVEGAPKEEDDS